MIDFGNGNTITLRNTLRSSLSADDFFFANSKNDFDGNGKSDILWQNADGTPAVWLMDGTGSPLTGPALPNPGPAWQVKDGGDFDGDGKADILWQNDDGTPAVWLMNGTDVLADRRRARQIRAQAGTPTRRRISTATARPTSCGRTTTARRPSG